MSKRSGKENVRATRNSNSSASSSTKKQTRPHEERASEHIEHEDDEQQRVVDVNAKRRRVGSAIASEEVVERKQTRIRQREHKSNDGMEAEGGDNDEVEESTDDVGEGELEQRASGDDDEDMAQDPELGKSDEAAQDADEEDHGEDDREEQREEAEEVDVIEGEPAKVTASPRSTSSSKRSPSPSSSSKAARRKSLRVSSRVSENGSTTSRSSERSAIQRGKGTKKKAQHATCKISPTSAQNLFQFTCRLLQSQKLEFEVRAREVEEKNARLATERQKWEKKIRGVKRQLRAYGHPVDEVEGVPTPSIEHGRGAGSGALVANSSLDPHFRANNANWNVTTTATALTTTTSTVNGGANGDPGSTRLVTMRDALASRTSFSSSTSGADSLLPVSIHRMEVQIQDTLRSRRQQMDELMKDLHGIHGLNDKITRLR